MPPSPAMRYSPGREPRADNHKRGRSFESGVPLKQRDDDLALFNEVQNIEKDNFLLQGDDDFDDIFANKLRHFSDYKLGINIPARGESSDLLHLEDEKNDYEWLITPPDTPLFTSLDDEPPHVNLAQRGRTRTQPISISRQSTMEKTRRSSRGSASPNRVSLSPRSHNSTFEGRNRTSSAPSPSPPLTTLRPSHSPPLFKSSPPSRKHSPVPRASTPPPPRRLSTGSIPNGGPTRGVRGNSASPKVKAWQSSIPGFSTEVPPNLRTSLADRPASYVRGSSPASRSSRQSMSPTASRSVGSPHSHERDRFSLHSKGSVGSSAEDDMEMESLSSVVVVGRQGSRRVGGLFQNNNNNRASPSKRLPSRVISSSSAPKRSFDLALRQMDHRKGQNMFRPLLSSVPSSTFHAGIGITSSPHHPMVSRNSSVTTSSNASSGLAISGAHDQDDATSKYVKVVQDHDHNHDVDDDDEVFAIEKDDGNDLLLNDSKTIMDRDLSTLTTFDDMIDINNNTEKGLLVCSRCGCGYSPIGPENVTNLCVDCMEESNSSLTIVDQVTTEPEAIAVAPLEPQMSVVEPLEVIGNNVKEPSGEHDDLVKDGDSEGKKEVNVEFTNLSKVESKEAAGISILLKRSSSIKGAILRNTNFSASSISYDDFSYVRDSANSMRSMSPSSSVDFGQTKHIQRPSSSTKSEIEHSKHQRSGSSLSGTSTHAFHPSSIVTDSFSKDVQENNDISIENDNENQTGGDSRESLLTISLKVDDNTTCIDGSDVTPLGTILEGEFDQSCRDFPPDVSLSIQELKEDVAVSADVDDETCNHTSNVTGESVVLIEDEGQGAKGGRSLTLEEATDTILFCSSIVHNLAHKAATIAIENENQSDTLDNNGSWPLIPATRKSDVNKPDPTTKRASKSQKSRNKKDTEIPTTRSVSVTNENEGKIDQPKTTRVVGVRENRENGESKKPPLLESKCNCTIM